MNSYKLWSIAAFGIAFAVSLGLGSKDRKEGVYEYAVLSENSTSWTLILNLSDLPEGSPYFCDFEEQATCTVESFHLIHPSSAFPIVVNKAGAGYQAVYVDARFKEE